MCFPYQTCEMVSDALHGIMLAPTSSGGRLPVSQAKIAWKTMLAAMHIRVHQAKVSLASLTDNEMFWKHHWTWHAGARGALPLEDAASSGASGPTAAERRLQSQLDRLQSQVGGKRRRGGNGGGKRGNGKGNNNNNGGNGGNGGTFNTKIPPAPGAGGGKSAGQKAFQNRKKFKGAGKK